MVSNVFFRGMLDMFLGVKLVAVRQVCVVTCLLVIAILRMMRCFFMVFGGLHQVSGSFLVMVSDRVRLH